MAIMIQAKSILSDLGKNRDDGFCVRYNMNLYRGCQHACIYCDSRSTCYQVQHFTEIEVKENAIELLRRELSSKRQKGVVSTGSMNDPYMPIERQFEQTRKALIELDRFRYPVHIVTKGDLITRDIDILQKNQKTWLSVSVTLTTTNDALARILEPGAPSPTRRIAAIKTLSEAGIHVGIFLMPILPFITDDPDNITNIVSKAAEAGASYIIYCNGMTLRDGSREYFYEALDKHFPGIREKYERRFGKQYSCKTPNFRILEELIQKLCRQYNLATDLSYDDEQVQYATQLSLFESLNLPIERKSR